MLQMLKDLIDEKDLRIIQNLYYDQTAAIRVNNGLSEWIKIEKGVRQGCVLSPDLFNLYSENILSETSDLKGVSIGGKNNMADIRYADDTVLMANSEKNLQDIVNKVDEASEIYGMALNPTKTEVMVISKKKDVPHCNIKIKSDNIKQVENFKYLGSTITSDVRTL